MRTPTTPRRVLILTPVDGFGGTQRHAVTLSRVVAGAGWEVRCVFPGTDPDRAARVRAWCATEGIAAETPRALRSCATPHGRRELAELARLVWTSHPDRVVVNFGGKPLLKALAAIRAAAPRARLIVEVHSVVEWSPRDAPQRRHTRLAGALSHRMVVHSAPVRASLMAAGVPRRKIVRIPYAVPSLASFPTRSEARARLGVSDGAVVIGCAARLAPEKGIADLIEATARIPDPGERLRLVIAGEGHLQLELQRLARDRLGSRAVFLGHLHDLASFYAALDVFALAPIWPEAFGLVYVEAAHHRVPSVASRVGGIADVVVDGETGLLVPKGDGDALTAALVRLVSDPQLRSRLGESAAARARAEFSVERLEAAYAAILR